MEVVLEGKMALRIKDLSKKKKKKYEFHVRFKSARKPVPACFNGTLINDWLIL